MTFKLCIMYWAGILGLGKPGPLVDARWFTSHKHCYKGGRGWLPRVQGIDVGEAELVSFPRTSPCAPWACLYGRPWINDRR